jgi:hypothetical protein
LNHHIHRTSSDQQLRRYHRMPHPEQEPLWSAVLSAAVHSPSHVPSADLPSGKGTLVIKTLVRKRPLITVRRAEVSHMAACIWALLDHHQDTVGQQLMT